jgi:multidrug efflux pump
MTSVAFTAGVIPLMLASGAGSEMRQAMGVAVFYGMIGVTLFGLLLTPLFYVGVRRLVERRRPRSGDSDTDSDTATAEATSPSAS